MLRELWSPRAYHRCPAVRKIGIQWEIPVFKVAGKYCHLTVRGRLMQDFPLTLREIFPYEREEVAECLRVFKTGNKDA